MGTASTRWSMVSPGKIVTLRPKRIVGPIRTVTVATVLGRNLADGLGIIDTDGTTYREFYYDIQIQLVPQRDVPEPRP